MTKMRAIEAAVLILEKEGATQAFGLPGAAINPLYAAMRKLGTIKHVLARHVEGASHMAEGYTRAKAGNIGICIGTSGPAGTDMITGLYSASADSIPILCITGQAPVARLHKEDFQAVDIAAIAGAGHQAGDDGAGAGPGAGRVPAGVPPDARRPGPGPVLLDLPFDVQMAEIEFDIETYEPLPVYKPAATRAQAEKALDMLAASSRPLIVAGGGIVNADAADLLVELAETLDVPVIPTLMGWGTIPDDHRLMAGMAGLQTSHRYGNATMLESDFVLGIGNRWANRHTGGAGRLPAGPHLRARRHRADPDRPGLPAGLLDRVRRQGRAGADGRGRQGARGRRVAGRPHGVGRRLRRAQAHAAASYPLRQRPGQAAAGLRGDGAGLRPGRDATSRTIGLSQIAGAQFLHVYKPRHWINCGQAGPLGWTIPATLGVSSPTRTRRSSRCRATTTSSS